MTKHITEMQTIAKSMDEKKINEKITEKIKPTQITYQGLCLTCENTATCTFPRKITCPVNQCEEFNIGHTPQPAAQEISNKTEYSISTHMNQDITPNQGLCYNCENIKTCTFPKLEGGVWHCEEYC